MQRSESANLYLKLADDACFPARNCLLFSKLLEMDHAVRISRKQAAGLKADDYEDRP